MLYLSRIRHNNDFLSTVRKSLINHTMVALAKNTIGRHLLNITTDDMDTTVTCITTNQRTEIVIVPQIVTITAKSGLGQPLSIRGAASVGSYASREEMIEALGKLGSNVGLYL